MAFLIQSLVPLTLTSGFALYSLLPLSLREERQKPGQQKKVPMGKRMKSQKAKVEFVTVALFKPFCLVQSSLDLGTDHAEGCPN